MSARVMASPRRRPRHLPVARPVQTLQVGTNKVVTLAWSPDGHYLAAGLQHGPILLFAVLPSATRPVRSSALRTYRGHTADVLQLAFSSTLLLASASMDRSVRLWHPHTAHCLRRLVHHDMVTAVAFNPRHDGVLLSAGCDGIARLWRLDDRGVVAQADAAGVVTAAAFLPDSGVCLGTYDGRVMTCRMSSDDCLEDDCSPATSPTDAALTATDKTTTTTTTMTTPTTTINSGTPTRTEAKTGNCAADTTSSMTSTAAVMTRSIAMTTTMTTTEGGPGVLVASTTAVAERRRARARRKAGLNKVSAVVTWTGETGAGGQDTGAYVTSADGRILVLRAQGMVAARLRVRKEGTFVGVSASPNAAWLLLDAIDGALRLVDLRAVSADADAERRSREREMPAPIYTTAPVLDGGATVCCASIANRAVLQRCGLAADNTDIDADVDAHSQSLLLAVGGNDGTLHIVEQELPW